MSEIKTKTHRAEIIERFSKVRLATQKICEPLEIEDFSSQPEPFVSPPKWHLAHTTWFFEAFILAENSSEYQPFHEKFSFLFNSYYNSVGTRVARHERGNITRPSIHEVGQYRKYVEDAMLDLMQASIEDDTTPLFELVEIGLNHEEQHQELLLMDIQYILFSNPLKPTYSKMEASQESGAVPTDTNTWLPFDEGLVSIGTDGKNQFSFDNERPQHKHWLNAYSVRKELVTNREYLAFVEDGGYEKFSLWHDEGWAWVQQANINKPFYWLRNNGDWFEFSLGGLQPLDLNQPVRHVSFYEAWAFAEWSGYRLPTEQEWENAAHQLTWGKRWEWTNSGYFPYPGFKPEVGAIGEYNGKFMVNQMVLKGASEFTPEMHSRATYRNFFHAQERWPLTGIRLAK